MSDVSLKDPYNTLDRLIGQVRSRVRNYTALSGSLLLFSAIVLVFWVTFGVDSGWFALQRLELPVPLRMIIRAGIVLGAAYLIFQHLLKPLYRGTRESELALVLERAFPQFQDRLITAVENRDGYPQSGALVQGMLQRTISQAESVAGKVTVGDVFDLRPVKQRGMVATLLLATVITGVVLQPQVLGHWWSAFVLCEDSYYERTTSVEFTVIAQPGDRRLSFRDTSEFSFNVNERFGEQPEGTRLYLHPRGADFELEVKIPDGKSASGGEWVVPERVRIDVIRFDGSRSRQYVNATEERAFRFILTRLQESVSIEVLAGDYRTRFPLRVESVAPPGLDTVEASCTYPDYMNRNETDDDGKVIPEVVGIMGSEVAFPIGTQFDLSAASNKGLQSVRVEADQFEVSGDHDSATVVFRGEGGGSRSEPVQLKQPLIADDGVRINLGLVLSLAGAQQKQELIDERLSLPSNASLKFYLHDSDDVISTSPVTLRIRGVRDKPPVIAVRTVGIGNAITRRAQIPLSGTITDDYGLTTARYEFLVDDETQWRSRDFENVFKPGLSYDLEAANGPESEYFRVTELVTEGQTLALAIVARDGCTLPEVNESRSEPLVFRIVSNEELLSLLYTRELSLRGRFEEVISKLTEIQDDFRFHVEIAERLESGSSPDTAVSDRSGLTNSGRNGSDSLRRQANELRSIAEGFVEIRAQLINNDIPPKQLATDMEANIIGPMNKVVDPRDGSLTAADQTVSRFRVAASDGKASSALLNESIDDVGKVIVQLRLILESVRDMAEFHELYQEGKLIHEELQKIWKDTRDLQKKRAIEKLKLFE